MRIAIAVAAQSAGETPRAPCPPTDGRTPARAAPARSAPRAEKPLSERLLELKARTAEALRPLIEEESGKAAAAEEIDVLEEVISDDEEDEDAAGARETPAEGKQKKGKGRQAGDADAGRAASNGLKRKAAE